MAKKSVKVILSLQKFFHFDYFRKLKEMNLLIHENQEMKMRIKIFIKKTFKLRISFFNIKLKTY